MLPKFKNDPSFGGGRNLVHEVVVTCPQGHEVIRLAITANGDTVATATALCPQCGQAAEGTVPRTS